MAKSIYSLVLSDDVVDAIDALAASSGISRSAMCDRILAERVERVTPEMRLKEIIDAVRRSVDKEFFYTEPPTNSSLSCRSTLKYRYKPTVRYSFEIYSEGAKRAGRLKVAFRTTSEKLIDDLTGFFRCWAALEQRYIARSLSEDIICTVEDGRFTRTLNMPPDDVSDDDMGAAVADYMAMFDGTMKCYFAQLPEIRKAAAAAEGYYSEVIREQKIII